MTSAESFQLTLTCSGNGVQRIAFGKGTDEGPAEMLAWARRELAAYLAGELQEFTVPIDVPEPQNFAERVQWALRDIPYGDQWTYGEMAKYVGSPRAARAVGTACATNPVPIIVPCHRIVRSTGIGNYGGGVELKKFLIEMEQATKS